ncbi:MAG: PQQ-binding-like beta-propeller repeat protein [Anaerolineae bacterium]|nr:PQQ-binding-like beta-propeller repeat protein [Gemmatimonadaceae bacterium]
MPRDIQELLFVGIKSEVVAIRRKDGSEVWRTKVKGSGFVNVLWDGEGLFAAGSGEVFRLNPTDGGIMWHNQMKGLGIGVVSMASLRAEQRSTSYQTTAEQMRREAASAAAG